MYSFEFSGDEVVKDCFNLDENASEFEIKQLLASIFCNPHGDTESVQLLDYKMKEKLSKFTQKINKLI